MTTPLKMHLGSIWKVDSIFRPLSQKFTLIPIEIHSGELSTEIMMEKRDSNTKMKSKEDIFEIKHFLKDHMHEWFRVRLVKEEEDL